MPSTTIQNRPVIQAPPAPPQQPIPTVQNPQPQAVPTVAGPLSPPSTAQPGAIPTAAPPPELHKGLMAPWSGMDIAKTGVATALGGPLGLAASLVPRGINSVRNLFGGMPSASVGMQQIGPGTYSFPNGQVVNLSTLGNAIDPYQHAAMMAAGQRQAQQAHQAALNRATAAANRNGGASRPTSSGKTMRESMDRWSEKVARGDVV